jgi:hypothetical protein
MYEIVHGSLPRDNTLILRCESDHKDLLTSRDLLLKSLYVRLFIFA